MAQTDRALELQHLNALLVAANHAISLLDEEEKLYQKEIGELKEGNQYLREVWQQVQERIRRNKASKSTRDGLSKEADFLKQSRLADDSGAGFSGFSSGTGLRFRSRMASGATGSSAAPMAIHSRLDVQATPRQPPGTPSQLFKHLHPSTPGGVHNNSYKVQPGIAQIWRGIENSYHTTQDSRISPIVILETDFKDMLIHY